MQVVSISGGADQRTAPFRLRGGKVRLRYDHGGDGLFLVSVAESEPAGEQDEEIYYADRSCSAPCRGTQPLDKQAGVYYVEVQSTRGPWSVVLEEYR